MLMKSEEFIEKMTNIQKNLLNYIDSDGGEEKFQNFKGYLIQNKIQDNQHVFKSFLYLLIKISDNHHRTDNFFNKIERILELFKDDMQKYFSNSELFHIFKSNKRILLFLFEEKIMNFDEPIAKIIIKNEYLDFKYRQYFQPEIQPFIKEKWFPKNNKNSKEEEENNLIQNEIQEDFYKKRKIGENDNKICRLIREDLLDDFIVYVNEKNYPLHSIINQSIYETNDLLLKKEKITLIEYAAFFGSIQIFNYLRLNKVQLMPSLWHYAIHGNNAEIIQILEENHFQLPQKILYEHMLKESIKCHHIEFAYYFQNNYSEYIDSKREIINGLKYYNFIFINNDKINETSFSYLCKYDYYLLAFILLNTIDIDINKKEIYKTIFFIQFLLTTYFILFKFIYLNDI